MRALAAARWLLAALWLAGAEPALAGEVSVLVAGASPSEVWSTGYGAAFTSTWFKALALEAELARLPGALEEQSMTTLSGGAFFAPPLGMFVPYAGVGIGGFRQSAAGLSRTGVVRFTGLGVKLILHDLLVVKVDYRFLRLSGDPLLTADRRLAAGVGLKF